MKIAFILDTIWDSAIIDYAFKIYKKTSNNHILRVFCLENSYISKKVDNPTYIKPIRTKNPLKSIQAFFDLYKKLKLFKPNIVLTIRGDATFFACLLKKNLNFELYRIFAYSKRLRTPPNCIDKVILPCEYLLDKIPKELASKSVVLKGFVDPNEFKFSPSGRNRIRKEFGIENSLVFGCVGRLDPVKGHSLLLKAFAKANVKNCTLFIVGEEKSVKVSQLKKAAEELKLKNVIFLNKRRNDIVDIMSSFDVGVISSINSEVIPRVLFEFLSIGLPVITTNVGCLGEISKECPSVTSVNPNVNELAKSIKNASSINHIIKNRNCSKKYDVNSLSTLFKDPNL